MLKFTLTQRILTFADLLKLTYTRRNLISDGKLALLDQIKEQLQNTRPLRLPVSERFKGRGITQ